MEQKNWRSCDLQLTIVAEQAIPRCGGGGGGRGGGKMG